MANLGVNIDHIATVRQARRTYEPDPVWAAAEAELGGAPSGRDGGLQLEHGRGKEGLARQREVVASGEQKA